MPFNNISICLLLILSFSKTQAQQTIFEYNLDGSKISAVSARLCFQEGKILGTILYETGADRFVLQDDRMIIQTSQQKISNNDTSKQNSYVLKKDFENIQLSYLTGFISNDTLVECNYAKAQKGLYFTQTILSTAVTSTTDTVFIAKDENLLVATSVENILYVICSVEKTDKLNIYVKRNGEKIKGYEKTIPFSNPVEKDKKKSKVFADYFSPKADAEYYVFEHNLSYPSMLSSVKNKIYVQHGKIIFSLENSIYETYLITLNLSGFSHAVRKYPSLPGITVATEDPSDFVNSYIRDSFLCKTGVFQDVFFLQVFNLSENEIIYNTFIKTIEKKEFAEAPFFKSGSIINTTDTSMKRIMWLLKNEYFYLLFDRGDSNRYNITLQLYHKKATFASFVGGILNFAISGGIAGMMSFYNWSADVAGAAILNSIDCRTGSITGTSNNKKPLYIRLTELKDFIEQNTVNADEPGFYIVDGSIYASCVDRGGGKLYVYKF